MKDMLRKRLALESQLQQEVSQEIKSQLVAVKGADAVKSEDVAKSFNKITEKEQVRKRSSSGTASVKKESLEGGSATSTSPNKTLMTNSPNKSNRSTKKLTKSPSESRAISSGSSGSKKKEKIFCICRTPYDNTKWVPNQAAIKLKVTDISLLFLDSMLVVTCVTIGSMETVLGSRQRRP